MVDLTDQRFGALKSPDLIGRLDPRARILAGFGFALMVSALGSLAALSAALLAAFMALGVSDLPVRQTLKRMVAMDGFIVVMLLMLPFSTPLGPAETPLFTLFGLPASAQGARHALDIALTANAAVLMALVLLGGLEPVVLAHGLARLGAPRALVHLMLFTLRYIAVLRAEYRRMRVAMRARAFEAGLSAHTLRSLGYVVGMLLVRAFERSERILQAMKCRGFEGQFPLIDEMRLGRADGVFAALILALFLVLGAL